MLDNFIKHTLLISEELSSGVYVRGFFMWHWLDPARRYSTPIHKVSYSLLWSRDEEKCLALLVRNPRFSCKKIYFFLHHSDGGGEALFQNKRGSARWNIPSKSFKIFTFHILNVVYIAWNEKWKKLVRIAKIWSILLGDFIKN